MRLALEGAPRITLLSSSARRREIVGGAFVNVAIEGSRGDEPRPEPGEAASEYVVRSALAKLGSPPWRASEGCLVSADTVVVLDGEILGKPVSDAEARSMLERLSDGWHQVVTGVAALDSATGRTYTGVETSDVRTRAFTDDETTAYIASGEPFDKAGGYAVQDERFRLVTRAEGCFLNIVGLPLCLLAALMRCLGCAPELREFDRIPYYGRCSSCKLGDNSEAVSTWSVT